MRILLPLDGSLVSETAFHLAADLARFLTAEIVVVRVTDPHEPLPAGAAGMASALCQAEQDSAHEYLERIARDLTKWGLRGTTLVALGRPVQQIVRVARQEAVDLIVMASHGRSGGTRWLLGSVAEGVLRNAPCPVLLCRGRTPKEFRGFERVVVPLDGSALAAQALPQVQRFLARSARVSLVRATDTLARTSELKAQKDSYQAYLDAVREELDAFDPANLYERRVLDCTPAEAILGVAEELEADLIAMSTHGRKGLSRALVGSVTERVARHATCPVLAFPPRVAGSGSSPASAHGREALPL